jgi:hypothetical protein
MDISKSITTLKESVKCMRPLIIKLKNDETGALVFNKRFSKIFDFLLDEKKFDKLMKAPVEKDDKTFEFLNKLNVLAMRIIVAFLSGVSLSFLSFLFSV